MAPARLARHLAGATEQEHRLGAELLQLAGPLAEGGRRASMVSPQWLQAAERVTRKTSIVSPPSPAPPTKASVAAGLVVAQQRRRTLSDSNRPDSVTSQAGPGEAT
jgi:hypothetical protein